MITVGFIGGYGNIIIIGNIVKIIENKIEITPINCEINRWACEIEARPGAFDYKRERTYPTLREGIRRNLIKTGRK